MSNHESDLTRFGFLSPPRPVSVIRPVFQIPIQITRQQPLVPRQRVPLSFRTMRQFQAEGIQAFLQHEPKHASLILPTGAGKTEMSLKLWDELGQPELLIVVPLIVNVMNPWLQSLKRIGIDPASVGTYYSEDKSVRFPITITLYKSLVENPWLLNEFQMILFDEEDLLQSEGYNELLLQSQSRPVVLGMTATIGEAIKRNPLIQVVMPVIYERTIKQATQEQILAPAEVIPIFVEMDEHERAEYERLHQLYLNYMSSANSSRLNPFEREQQRKRAFMKKNSMLILLSNVHTKMEKVIRLLKDDKYSTTLVFSSSVGNAENIKRRLEQDEIKSEVIKAGIPREQRQPILNNLGQTYNVLISIATLERGFDIPFASKEIIVGSGTSLRQAEQRVGRILRIDPNNPDKHATIYVLTVPDTFDADVLRNVRTALTRVTSRGTIED